MGSCKIVRCSDGGARSFDPSRLVHWSSRDGRSRIYELTDDRYVLDAEGCPCHELAPTSAAQLFLQWGWHLPSTLARAVEQRREEEDGPRQRFPLPSAHVAAPVILSGPERQPIVLGTPVPLLTIPQYDVVSTLVDAGPNGLSLSRMQKLSKRDDARNILRRARKSSPEWEPVIQFPGTPGRGYRIAVPA